jgi:hypothetical protein
MNKDDLFILIIALLLLGGMLITIFWGGADSRHGVGGVLEEKPGQQIFTLKKEGLI